ncbi:hypothetical protein BDF21DRAFT_425066 [Thamnidium elegans]|nr:hypothetical protein BDF21DRAFT_425066 [Thamnidium elegans]
MSTVTTVVTTVVAAMSTVTTVVATMSTVTTVVATMSTITAMAVAISIAEDIDISVIEIISDNETIKNMGGSIIKLNIGTMSID